MTCSYPATPALRSGFTLIELALTVTIIGILAAVALPAYSSYTTRAKLTEALTLAEPVKKTVHDYYERWGVFPTDNPQAGLAAPDTFIGNYVQSIAVNQGTIEVTLTRIAANTVNGKKLHLRPAVNASYPTGPVVWVCEQGKAPAGIALLGGTAEGALLDEQFLPTLCRKPQ